MANFRGTGHRIGKRAKQSTKHARAATLHAPKTSNRSQRLTNAAPRSISMERYTARKGKCVKQEQEGYDGLQERTVARSDAGHQIPRASRAWFLITQALGSSTPHSQAKKPSSSSLRLAAGNGAPGASLCVGSLT